MPNHRRLPPAAVADNDPNAIEIASVWMSSDGQRVGTSLWPDIFTTAEDWGYLIADILRNAVSAQKQVFGVDEKEYYHKALEGMYDRSRKTGITTEGVYGGMQDLIDGS